MPSRAAVQAPWMAYSEAPSPRTATTGRSGRPMRRPAAAGSPKPRPPMAALTKPIDSRACRRVCSSGRFEGDSSSTTASAGRRSARAART